MVIGEQLTAHQQQQHQQQNHHQIQQQKQQILPNTTATQQQPPHHLTATVASVGLQNQLQHCRNSTATDVITTTAPATTAGASTNLANSSNINNPQPTPKKSNNNNNTSFNNNLHIINSYQSNNTVKNIASTALTGGTSVAASLATTNSNFPNVYNSNSINSNNGKVKNGQQILAGNVNIGCNVVGNPNSNGITINNNNNNHINNTTTNNNSNNINNNINNIASTGGFACGVGGTATTTAIAAKSQLEQLNTMREALFSQDGWGCQHVNQDTNWEVPSSPEPTNKDPTGAPVMWKPTINNGTDLWETNLRNGGQPPAQPVQKTPWGHTPTSNLGGTWGEDDDGTDSSSVWAGSASNPNAGSGVSSAGISGGGNSGGGPSGTGGPQWGQSTVGVGGANSSSGPNATNIGSVGTGVANNSTGVSVSGGAASSGGGGGANLGTSGNGWGDPRELRSGPMGGPLDMRSVDSMRAASAGDPRDIRILDPRDPIRGDPRGISGRLNGTSEMWGQHHPIAAHNPMQGMNKIVGPGANAGNVGAAVVAANSGVNNIGPGGNLNVSNPVAAAAAAAGNVSTQWGAAQSVVGPKDITSLTSGKQVTGWEEPSPPPQRRNIPNYDDGTSLWSQQSRVPGGATHWKDISDRHIIRNTIGNQNASTVVGTGSGLVAGAQVGGIGSQGGVGVTGNNPMGGVGPQNRLSAVGPSGVGVGGIGHGKPENTMWVHPNNNVAVGGRSGATWGDDNSHNVGVSAGGNNTNWVDDKPNVNISGQIGANVGNTSSWNDTTACWNKNQNKITSGTSSSGWGTTTAANSGVGANEANDLSSDWTSTTHSGMVPNKQQQQQQQKLSNTGVSLAGIGGGLNTDIIKQSKQYRILVDNGFKKDDVERALINANMNIEEAAEILRNNPSNIVMEGWRRHDETLGSYVDHANSAAGGGYSGRYPVAPTQPSITFPPNNILNNMGGSGAVGANGNNPNLTALNAMQPLQVQKYINQAQHAGVSSGSAGPQSVNAVAFGQNPTNVTNASAATTSSNQPSAQQLRMLVQQIQLAVHSGYLSSQILNQPLAPTTLLLLNQLLTSIKHLQGVQQSLGRGSNNMQIAKCKQTIQNLQNQINAQQAMYIKQQQQQQQQQQSIHQQQNAQQHTNVVTTGHVNNPNTEYIRGQHDAISALQNFGDISLNKTGGYQNSNQQSRLNQWKLPVLDKDLTGDATTDFSRAPGATKQNINVVTSVNNMAGPLGLQTDGTWSTGRNIGDGWPDTNVSSVTTATTTATNDENKDWSVQEFEPGKPWKGPQIKNIEDDPSITPGSVARSPLSINPTPKEADIFSNASKNSPTDLPPLSLSSSTWSFNPTSNNQGFSSWSDNAQPCSTSELWATPTTMNKPSRGPPPGLIGTNKNVVGVGGIVNPNAVLNAPSSNGWLAAAGRNGGGSNPGVLLSNSGGNVNWAANNAAANSSNSNWNSNWLLLKNLTVQIDGATLRTLCRQHGPPITFHLYLNQGIALCKYATREEANKAQMTLNNCVLGNTTICAESPSETEVQSILQHLPQLQQQQVQQPSSTTATANSNVIVGGGGVSGSGLGVVGGGNGNGASNTSNNHVASVVGVSTNCSNNSVSNANAAVNSVLNGNNGTNVTNNNGTTSNNSSVAGNNAQNQNLSVATTGGGNGVGGGNASNNVSVATVSNNVTINANTNLPTANWRQTQQQQQNQTRPSGREADFDYISKYVCSIVDD